MNSHRYLAAIPVLAAATLAGVTSARAEGLRIGVVVATRVNVTEGEADALGSALADALRDQLVVDVVAGAESRRRLPAGGMPEDCVAQPSCVRDVAERLGADELLFLVVVRLGPRVQIDPTWARPRTEQVASRAAIVIEDGKQGAPDLFAGRARRLFPEAPVRLVNAPLTGERGSRGRRITRGAGIAGAVSLAALAGGIGLALAARSDYDELEADGCDRSACPGVDDRVDSMEDKALAADVLFGASAVAAGVAVILYLGSGSGEEAPVRVGADSHGAHVWLGGRF
ncbi:MAG TPA: hypothetical protein VFU21_12415 [Kofleriaceae bacterium]|nr:hypothetical protein [Kofleriaceae bacterium]